MLPDYPHKIFSDKRSPYFLLMETLAMDNYDNGNKMIGQLGTFSCPTASRRRGILNFELLITPNFEHRTSNSSN